MSAVEKEAWIAFRHVVHSFLENKKSDNYKKSSGKLNCTVRRYEMQNVNKGALPALTLGIFQTKFG